MREVSPVDALRCTNNLMRLLANSNVMQRERETHLERGRGKNKTKKKKKKPRGER